MTERKVTKPLAVDRRVGDPVAEAAYLELPGKPSHPRGCACSWCDQVRHTWDLAIKRGVWSRERVLAYGEEQALRGADGGGRGGGVGRAAGAVGGGVSESGDQAGIDGSVEADSPFGS